jgi:hypothetical protein
VYSPAAAAAVREAVVHSATMVAMVFLFIVLVLLGRTSPGFNSRLQSAVGVELGGDGATSGASCVSPCL